MAPLASRCWQQVQPFILSDFSFRANSTTGTPLLEMSHSPEVSHGIPLALWRRQSYAHPWRNRRGQGSVKLWFTGLSHCSPQRARVDPFSPGQLGLMEKDDLGTTIKERGVNNRHPFQHKSYWSLLLHVTVSRNLELKSSTPQSPWRLAPRQILWKDPFLFLAAGAVILIESTLGGKTFFCLHAHWRALASGGSQRAAADWRGSWSLGRRPAELPHRTSSFPSLFCSTTNSSPLYPYVYQGQATGSEPEFSIFCYTSLESHSRSP